MCLYVSVVCVWVSCVWDGVYVYVYVCVCFCLSMLCICSVSCVCVVWCVCMRVCVKETGSCSQSQEVENFHLQRIW